MTTETIEQPETSQPVPDLPVAQPVAPAQEPAAPAPPEPPAAPPVTFEETGDTALDVSLMYAAQHGLTPESPEIIAARAGDFSKIEEYFKTKQAPGWEKQVELARGAYQRVVSDTQARHKAIEAAVHTAVGGEAAWKSAASWAATHYNQSQRDEINAALSQGGIAAEAMGRLVVSSHQQAVGKPARAPSAGGVAAPPSGDMTARDYGKQVDALMVKHRGKDITRLPEYMALQEARLAARARGV